MDSLHAPVICPAASQAVQQPLMRPWRTHAHEKDLPRVFVFVAVGIGIGIAFGIEIAIGRHFDIDADSDPDSDPEIS